MVAWPSSMRAIYNASNKTIHRLHFLGNSSPLSIALKATIKRKCAIKILSLMYVRMYVCLRGKSVPLHARGAQRVPGSYGSQIT